ncbi:MAG: hypothetical protein KDA96_00895 [Planctomycetaceae bacterium]|nr:hypothetical protein [Planctomycetaceae bacterium]
MSEESTEESADAADAALTDLVAYLDGELSESDTDSIEHRLVEDAGLRDEADRLDRAWKMLDSIDEVSASKEFTARTLASMQATSIDATLSKPSVPRTQTIPGQSNSLVSLAFWAITGFLVSMLGLEISQRQADRRQDETTVRILKNINFLRQVPKYRTVQDVESLQRLLEDSEEAGP